MSTNYGNSESMVRAVLRREHDKQLPLADAIESGSVDSMSSTFCPTSQFEFDATQFILPSNYNSPISAYNGWKAFVVKGMFSSSDVSLPQPLLSANAAAFDIVSAVFHNDALVDMNRLHVIAETMIRSGYEKECWQVYSMVRQNALDECMVILGVEEFKVEGVKRFENWSPLSDKVEKWIQAVKVVIRFLLPSEKFLCQQIFSEFDSIKEICFLGISKLCVMQLLNFGEAVAMVRSTDSLFTILDMYDALAQVLPDLRVLFGDNTVCSEANGVLYALGEASIKIITNLENEVQGLASRKPVKNGGIHPLSRDIMNYLKLLLDYSNTISLVLENAEVEPNKSERWENTNGSSRFTKMVSALVSSLQSNIEKMSRMYEDVGMQNIFLMNNMQYIVQKVKDTELRNLLGSKWVQEWLIMIRKYAIRYLRASWAKAVACLEYEGLGEGLRTATKGVIKERFKNFNACFEDIYRIQTAWIVPDLQLCDELRISISQNLIPGYRTFMNRFGSLLGNGRLPGKYIKYTAEDLENYLADLFKGMPRILVYVNKRYKSVKTTRFRIQESTNFAISV